MSILMKVVQSIIAGTGLLVPEALSDPEVRPMSCGEVSVHVICAMYGVDSPRDRVLAILQPGVSGESSLAQVVACLRQLGFRCQMARGSMDALFSWQGPFIIHLKGHPSDAFGHFTVVVACPDRKGVTVYDPMMSLEPMLLRHEVLERQWTGFAILVSPPQPMTGVAPHLSLAAGLFLLGVSSAWFRSLRSANAPGGGVLQRGRLS